jgi:hypothetical protein
MSMRLRQGLKATRKAGYHGYKWKGRERLRLSVWEVSDFSDNNKLELETLEAEVVFLCRSLDGQWPESQNEIHFHPSGRRHRALAVKVYNEIQENPSTS